MKENGCCATAADKEPSKIKWHSLHFSENAIIDG